MAVAVITEEKTDDNAAVNIKHLISSFSLI